MYDLYRPAAQTFVYVSRYKQTNDILFFRKAAVGTKESSRLSRLHVLQRLGGELPYSLHLRHGYEGGRGRSQGPDLQILQAWNIECV